MKKSLGKKTLLYVHPVFIIGSYDKEMKPNIMAVSWGGICCSVPPCVTISLRKETYTYHNIMHSQAYTVNIPSEKFVKEADFTGVYSGRDVDKFSKTKLTAVKSTIVNAPYVEEFPLTLHCKLLKTVEIGKHTQFIGEILDVQADEEVLNPDGTVSIEKVQPFLYDSSIRAYFGVGGKLADAFKVKEIW